MRHTVLHIEGMSCSHCLNAVNKALAGIPGVTVDSVRIGRAEVSYDERLANPAALESAVTEAGYRTTAA